MIHVEGADPGVLNRRMRHHAENLRPLIDALLYTIVLNSRFGRDNLDHVIRQSRSGPGSFALLTAEGKEYHFRNAASTSPRGIDVYDTYNHHWDPAHLVTTITTPAEARRFIRSI